MFAKVSMLQTSTTSTLISALNRCGIACVKVAGLLLFMAKRFYIVLLSDRSPLLSMFWRPPKVKYRKLVK